jgi:hypothetical protein
MSLPIKNTPILRGKDAEKFIYDIEKNRNNSVSKEEYNQAKKIYDTFRDKNAI